MKELKKLREIRSPYFEFKHRLCDGSIRDKVDGEVLLVELNIFGSFDTVLNYVDKLILDPREEDRARIALRKLDEWTTTRELE